MPRLPEYPENWEPAGEKDEVLDILANPFEPGEKVFVDVRIEVEIVRYYKDGFYEVRFPNGMWEDDLVVYHHSNLQKDPDRERRNT